MYKFYFLLVILYIMVSFEKIPKPILIPSTKLFLESINIAKVLAFNL